MDVNLTGENEQAENPEMLLSALTFRIPCKYEGQHIKRSNRETSTFEVFVVPFLDIASVYLTYILIHFYTMTFLPTKIANVCMAQYVYSVHTYARHVHTHTHTHKVKSSLGASVSITPWPLYPQKTVPVPI